MSEPKTNEERFDAYKTGIKMSIVATARQHLGPGSEAYCEQLGNEMVAHLDQIWAAVGFTSTAAPVAGLDPQELRNQMHAHAGIVARKAVHAMEDLVSKALIAAKMAYGGGPPEDAPRAN
jgi:hypothetical protein